MSNGRNQTHQTARIVFKCVYAMCAPGWTGSAIDELLMCVFQVAQLKPTTTHRMTLDIRIRISDHMIYDLFRSNGIVT